jgi:osmoprotectant transport system ATP-binding protein
VATAIHLRAIEVDAPAGAKILRGVELSIESGECLTLIGKSGAGKSTTLRLINGLVAPTRGEVVVEGKPLRDHDLVQLRRRTGYVIQQVGLLPHLDVAANVAIVPGLLGWDASRIDARVDEVLALVGLDPMRFRGRKPRALSGGERQRVGVARALAGGPSIVLMDEPFGAVDPLVRAELQRDVDALRRRLGTTVVLVTHDVREAIVMSDRVALLDEGKVAFVGTPRALLASDHPVAKAYAASLVTGQAALDARLSDRPGRAS